MADGIPLNSGSGGKTLASNEISGKDYQRVKLIHGADGTNDGDVATGNGLPVSIQDAIPAGTALIGAVDLNPTTSGGLSASHLVSAATTNATVIKNAAGKVYGVIASNVNAAVRYLKLYDLAVAPTVGTSTVKLTIPMVAGTTGPLTFVSFPHGIDFSTGISIATTTEATDSGTTAISANESTIHILYK